MNAHLLTGLYIKIIIIAIIITIYQLWIKLIKTCEKNARRIQLTKCWWQIFINSRRKE